MFFDQSPNCESVQMFLGLTATETPRRKATIRKALSRKSTSWHLAPWDPPPTRPELAAICRSRARYSGHPVRLSLILVLLVTRWSVTVQWPATLRLDRSVTFGQSQRCLGQLSLSQRREAFWTNPNRRDGRQ